jgi:hypothetical protein
MRVGSSYVATIICTGVIEVQKFYLLRYQCCGFGPGSGSPFILVGWIQIRVGITDPDPGGPK